MFVDFSQHIKAEHYLEDGVHLNEFGHIKMKDTAYIFLSKMIN